MEAVKTINRMINSKVSNINVSQLGKVVSYDKDNKFSTIQPLVIKEGQTQPLLISVPVADHVSSLEVGDMVVVLFLDMDSDNALLSNQISSAGSTRTHDMSDAVVIASLTRIGGA